MNLIGKEKEKCRRMLSNERYYGSFLEAKFIYRESREFKELLLRKNKGRSFLVITTQNKK